MDRLTKSKKFEERLPKSSDHAGVSRSSTTIHVKTHPKRTEEANPTCKSTGGDSGGCSGGSDGSGSDGERGDGGDRAGGGAGGGGGSFRGSSLGGLRDANGYDCYDSFARSLRDICPRALDGDRVRINPPDHAATVGKVGDGSFSLRLFSLRLHPVEIPITHVTVNMKDRTRKSNRKPFFASAMR